MSPQDAKQYTTLFLDIDGTLVDSNAAHAQAWSRACRQYGYDRTVEFFRPLIGMGGDRVLPKIDARLDDRQSPGKDIGEARKKLFLNEFLPDLRPTAGAKKLVLAAQARGITCVVASSGSDEEVARLLQLVGVDEQLTRRVAAWQVDHSKPAPDSVARALELCGCDPSAAVLLADTPYDIESARQAEVDTIALTCGGWNRADLHGAVAIYENPAALLNDFATFFR